MLNTFCLNEWMNDPINQWLWASSKGILTCMHLSGFKSQLFEWALKAGPFQRDPAFFLWGCSNRCTCVLLFTDCFDYATPTRHLLQYSLFPGWWHYGFLESIVNISIASFFLYSLSRVETYLKLLICFPLGFLQNLEAWPLPFCYGDGHPVNSKDNPGIFITKCFVSVATQLIYNTGPQSTFSKTANRKSWILKGALTYIHYSV